jgi:hypothetical protein
MRAPHWWLDGNAQIIVEELRREVGLDHTACLDNAIVHDADIIAILYGSFHTKRPLTRPAPARTNAGSGYLPRGEGDVDPLVDRTGVREWAFGQYGFRITHA